MKLKVKTCTTRCVLFLLAIQCIGCAQSSGKGKAEPAQTDIIFEKISSITISGTEAHPLFSSVDPFVSGKHIAVPDYLGNVVRVYDKEGEMAFVLGREGKGPGEFNMPYSVFEDEQHRFIVNDRGNMRVQMVDSLGTYIDGFSAAGQNEKMFVLHDGTQEIVRMIGVAGCEQASCLVQDYALDSGKLVRSFGGLNTEETLMYSWASYQSTDLLLIVNMLGNRIDTYTLTGDHASIKIDSPSFLNVDTRDVPQHPREQVKWFRSNQYSSVAGLALVDDLIFVQHKRNNYGDPELPYLIDVYWRSGELLKAGIAWRSKLFDVQNDQLVFVHEDQDGDGSLTIEFYAFSITE